MAGNGTFIPETFTIPKDDVLEAPEVTVRIKSEVEPSNQSLTYVWCGGGVKPCGFPNPVMTSPKMMKMIVELQGDAVQYGAGRRRRLKVQLMRSCTKGLCGLLTGTPSREWRTGSRRT